VRLRWCLGGPEFRKELLDRQAFGHGEREHGLPLPPLPVMTGGETLPITGTDPYLGEGRGLTTAKKLAACRPRALLANRAVEPQARRTGQRRERTDPPYDGQNKPCPPNSPLKN
jgi:hypothetical protein